MNSEENKKKALAYLGGPKQLKDFIWYYLVKGKEYEWSLICQPMYKEMRLQEVCENSRLFDEIYMVDSYFLESKTKLVKIGLQMVWFWLIGKNKEYACKEISKIICLDEYSHFCISTTRGVTPGLLTLCVEGKSVDILEDGIGDDTKEDAHFEWRRIKEPNYLVSYFFARMGYFNFCGLFPLQSTKYCNRYSEHPEKLSRNLYKQVFLLNDMTKIDSTEYKDISERTFGAIASIDDCEAVLFTTNMKDFSSEYQELNKKVIRFLLKKKYNRLALKRHPRDFSDYLWDGEIIECNSMIPAEDIIDQLNQQDVYFMFPSAAIQWFAEKGHVIHIFFFRNLCDSLFYNNNFNRTLQELQGIEGLSLLVEEI